MSLGSRRRRLAELKSKFILWIKDQEGFDCQEEESKRTFTQQLCYFYGVQLEEVENEEVLSEKTATRKVKVVLNRNSKGKWRRASRTKNSGHVNGTSFDLSLFKLVDGRWEYLTETEDYTFIGEKWKSMSIPEEHIICVWGGDFKGFKDGNHFGIE